MSLQKRERSSSCLSLTGEKRKSIKIMLTTLKSQLKGSSSFQALTGVRRKLSKNMLTTLKSRPKGSSSLQGLRGLRRESKPPKFSISQKWMRKWVLISLSSLVTISDGTAEHCSDKPKNYMEVFNLLRGDSKEQAKWLVKEFWDKPLEKSLKPPAKPGCCFGRRGRINEIYPIQRAEDDSFNAETTVGIINTKNNVTCSKITNKMRELYPGANVFKHEKYPVVVKRMEKMKKDGRSKIKAIRREILIHAVFTRLAPHDNIVKLLKVYENDTFVYVVQEYGGDDIYNEIGNTQLDGNEYTLGDYITRAIAAVKHMHKYKVLHLDIKSENFVVTSSAETGNSIKLIDFGHAFFMQGMNNETMLKHISSRNTGTIGCHSPEQFMLYQKRYQTDRELADHAEQHMKLGEHIDIWAIGCMAIEMGCTRRTSKQDHPARFDRNTMNLISHVFGVLARRGEGKGIEAKEHRDAMKAYILESDTDVTHDDDTTLQMINNWLSKSAKGTGKPIRVTQEFLHFLVACFSLLPEDRTWSKVEESNWLNVGQRRRRRKKPSVVFSEL